MSIGYKIDSSFPSSEITYREYKELLADVKRFYETKLTYIQNGGDISSFHLEDEALWDNELKLDTVSGIDEVWLDMGEGLAGNECHESLLGAAESMDNDYNAVYDEDPKEVTPELEEVVYRSYQGG